MSTRRNIHTRTSTPPHFRRIPAWLLAMGCSFPLFGCGSAAPPAEAAPPPPPPPPPAEHIPPPVEEAEATPGVTILADHGFATPESVVFDKKRDVYLVSNINGSPHGKDQNGFISKITPLDDDKYKVDTKFIDGAGAKSKLDAPKGLAIVGDTLYVADLDRVRLFDATTGTAQGEIELPGATFANGVAGGKNGLVYVTDSGLDEKFASNGSDAVWLIKNGKAKKIISGPELGGPNGVVAGDGGVWVTTFGSGELYWVSDKGKLSERQKLTEGKNDGLVSTDDGRLLISSWSTSSVYSGKPGEEFHKEISGVESPADIGLDCTRGRVLIPLFTKNSVVIHTLSEKSAEK